MRITFVRALAAASVLVANIACAEGPQVIRRPWVTVATVLQPVKAPPISVAGSLLSLGSAVSATLNGGNRAGRSVAATESASTQIGADESVQVVALWKTHANSSGPMPLARPL
jgi:hypothetical protein